MTYKGKKYMSSRGGIDPIMNLNDDFEAERFSYFKKAHFSMPVFNHWFQSIQFLQGSG